MPPICVAELCKKEKKKGEILDKYRPIGSDGEEHFAILPSFNFTKAHVAFATSQCSIELQAKKKIKSNFAIFP